MIREPGRSGFWNEQARVMHALIVREIYTRFGRENVGFAWIVLEPVLFCLAIIALWTVALDKQGHFEVPLVEFLITGYMPLIIYRHSVNRILRCMQANADLLYHRQISIIAMYAARLTIEILGAMAAFVITTALFVVWGIAAPPQDVPMMLAGFGVYALFVTGLAVLLGALSERTELVEKIWSPLSYISVPLSGTFYMLYWLPQGARDVLVWVPMATGVEMIRGGYFGPGVPVFYEWESAVAVSLVLLAAGLALLRGAHDHVDAR